MMVDPVITTQPVNQSTNAGQTVLFSVVTAGAEPLNYQWRKDSMSLEEGGKISGANGSTLTLTGVLHDDGGEYQVVVTNSFGSVTSIVATLSVRDPAIIVEPASRSSSEGQMVTLSASTAGTPPLSHQWRKDGVNLSGATNMSLTLADAHATDAGNYDIVVTNRYGSLTSLVAELSVNFATSDSFDPAASGAVGTLAVQTDGKILAGGYFIELGGQTRYHLGRLNGDGSLDKAFNPGAVGGPNPYVYSFAVLPNSTILVGGGFTTLGGMTHNSIGRLNANGGVDESFNPAGNNTVDCLTVQPDGGILLGGSFYMLNGQWRYYIGRLNTDGSLDATSIATPILWSNASRSKGMERS